MTAREAIKSFRAERPRFDDEALIAKRVDAVNRMIFEETVRPYDGTAVCPAVRYPDGLDAELLAPAPWDDVYVKYLRMEDAAATPTDPSCGNLMTSFYTRLAEYANSVGRARVAPRRELKL